MKEIRWRLNDPAHEWRQRWTKVHRTSRHAEDITACHITIPDDPYMLDTGDDIPADAPRCKRCLSPDHREA